MEDLLRQLRVIVSAPVEPERRGFPPDISQVPVCTQIATAIASAGVNEFSASNVKMTLGQWQKLERIFERRIAYTLYNLIHPYQGTEEP
jgi:hypothetical protein